MAKLLNVYIHEDNEEGLEEVKNKSALINDLLREHFRKLDPNKMTPEEIRKEIAKRKLEAEYKAKLEALQ